MNLAIHLYSRQSNMQMDGVRAELTLTFPYVHLFLVRFGK